MTDVTTLERARQALEDHAWADAYDGFVSASGERRLHAAEATDIAADYASLGVHQAARVGALAEAGEIVVTCETLEGTSIGYPASEERVVALKGIACPVRVASIEWRPGSR